MGVLVTAVSSTSHTVLRIPHKAFRSVSYGVNWHSSDLLARLPIIAFSGDAILHTREGCSHWLLSVNSAISCKNMEGYEWVSLLICISFLVILPM